jgi:hypothetical protein
MWRAKNKKFLLVEEKISAQPYVGALGCEHVIGCDLYYDDDQYVTGSTLVSLLGAKRPRVAFKFCPLCGTDLAEYFQFLN